jgi:hypothetical protein
MRFVAVTIWLVLLLAHAGAEEMACRSYLSGGNFIEWVERGKQRGLRIVAHNPKWTAPTLGLEGTRDARCETCPSEQITDASFRLAVGDLSQSKRQDQESATSSEAVAAIMTSIPFYAAGATFSAKSDAMPASIGDLTGLARRIGIELAGRSAEVTALQVDKGCVSVFAVLSTRDGAPIAADGLAVFARGIGVEWYTPAQNPDVLRPFKPEKFLGLGDGFRPKEWGLK